MARSRFNVLNGVRHVCRAETRSATTIRKVSEMWMSQYFLKRIVLPSLIGMLISIVLGGISVGRAADLSSVVPIKPCESLNGKVIHAGDDPVRIQTAEVVGKDTLSAFCDVTGYVAPQVKFNLHLPIRNWHQRLLFTGCGGFCGVLNIRVKVAEGCAAVTDGEFATVSSSLGHDSGQNVGDAVWARNNPQGRLDWGRRGVHVVTLAAKAIISDFYGRTARYSYFNGCSDGGREAMMEVQTYPSDFNGVIAGAPVMNVTANNTIFHAWVAQHLLNPDGSGRLSKEKLNMVHEAALARCAGRGNTSKEIIANPAACDFSPAELVCTETAQSQCLSLQEAKLVDALYAGPTDETGKPLYFGLPKGSELEWPAQARASQYFAEGFATYLSDNPSGQPVEINQMGYLPADLARYNRFAEVLNATSTDIRAFQQAGGKLIMWHGWNDVGVPPGSTVSYMNSVRSRLGNAATDQFTRLYMLPGVNHCGGGIGPDKMDLMSAIMHWVENGQAPAAIRVKGDQAKTDVLPFLVKQ